VPRLTAVLRSVAAASSGQFPPPTLDKSVQHAYAVFMKILPSMGESVNHFFHFLLNIFLLPQRYEQVDDKQIVGKFERSTALIRLLVFEKQ
jgi:hypothetical protein